AAAATPTRTGVEASMSCASATRPSAHQAENTARLTGRSRLTRTGCRKWIGTKESAAAKTTTANEVHSPVWTTNRVKTTMFHTTGNPLKKFSDVFIPVSA